METKPTKETLKQWHDDRSNCRMGICYFNKKDKRLLPPKRMAGFGWTVNFANPYSILLVIILIIVIFAIGYFIRF